MLSVLHEILGQAAVEQPLGILQWCHLSGPGIIVGSVLISQSKCLTQSKGKKVHQC
jgi:hypothetical protein